MKIYAVKDYDAMSKKAAEILAAKLILKPNAVLGLATGSTPVGTYKNLIDMNSKGLIDFSQVKSVNLDEYVGLTGDHDQSYRYFMNTNLFDHVNIDKANTNVPSGIAADTAAECARYDKVIADMGGVDIQVLGIGNNGHIGFNEPDSVFTRGTHIVELTQGTRDANARFFASIDDVPTKAITMGVANIMFADTILLLASGEAKAQAVYDTVMGSITPNVPASILQLHKNVIIVADEAALKLIPASMKN